MALQFGESLTDDTSIIIYDHIVFMIKATDQWQKLAIEIISLNQPLGAQDAHICSHFIPLFKLYLDFYESRPRGLNIQNLVHTVVKIALR